MFRKYGTSMLLLPQGNLYIAPHSESETLQEGRQGTWVSSNTLCDLILPTFIKKGEFVCLVESAVRRMERQKRQSADKISHHSCWLVATPPPPFLASFVSGNCINLTIPLCAIIFHPIMSLLWRGLSFTSPRCCFWTEPNCVVVISTRISRSSSHSLHIHKHTLETENATPEMHFTEPSEKYVLHNQKQPQSR